MPTHKRSNYVLSQMRNALEHDANFCKHCRAEVPRQDQQVETRHGKASRGEEDVAGRNSTRVLNRLNRRTYLTGQLISILIGVGILQLGTLKPVQNGNIGLSVLILVVYVSVLLFEVSLCIRRLHDLGQSGWLTLLGLIPIISLIVTVVLLISAGEAKANKYGNRPKPKIDLMAAFGINSASASS